MATTHIAPISVLPGRTSRITVRDSVNYYKNSQKTDGGRLITAMNCETDTVAEEMLLLHRQYEFATGKPIDAPLPNDKKPILLYLARQSFLPGEVDADTAHEMGVKLAERLLGDRYQYIVTTHVDTKHIHNNILWNAVNLDLKKYNIKKYTYQVLRRRSDELCEEYGTSIVIPGKERRNQTYSKCRENSFRDVLRSDITAALESAHDFNEFLKRMEERYTVSWRGKNLRFLHRTNGQKRPFRADSLGVGYDEQSLRRYFQNRVPQKRIALTYSQQLSVRQKLALENNRNLTYSARLRNIQAMADALHVIGQNAVGSYRDFETCMEKLEAKESVLLQALSDVQKNLQSLHSLSENLRLYQESKPLFEEYSRALLKERFWQSHRAELELFEAAGELLRARGFDPDTLSTQQLSADTARETAPLEQKAAEIQTELSALEDKRNGLARARRTVDRIRSDYCSRTFPTHLKKSPEKYEEEIYARR